MSLAPLLLISLLACAETDPVEAPAAGPPPPAAPAAPAAARERVLGTWAIVLSEEERRQVELLQLAFRQPPPTEEELAAATLSPDERSMVKLMAAAAAADPSDPKVAEMKAAADGLSQATLTITADAMTFQAGAVTEVSSWTVQAEAAESLTIEAVEAPGPDGAPGARDVATITFEGDDRIVMADADEPAQRQVFTRRR
ncbi:hypothetical protein L6R53_10780 [Myxococcota bacterium]|nr:hypothetical protein [Myxococcota bacterium]